MRLMDLIHRHGRAAEWMTATALTLFGLTLLLPGDTMALSPAYRGFIALGFTDASLGATSALVGALRMVALYLNGTWRRSPVVRAVGAILGAGLFAGMSVAFQWPYLVGDIGAASTGTVYLVFALGDFLSAARAGADAGTGQ